MSFNRGSEWRKWDLHLHTPSSYDYKNKSITNKEIVDKLIKNSIAVVAITDHHIIDIERIKELQSLSKDKITILPGIEFLSDARGKQAIHFIGIFAEDCNLEHIWGQIENKTKINEIKGKGININAVYCDLDDTISLIHELGGIVTIHAGQKHSNIENITHSLPHGMAQKTDIANKVDFYELGKVSDQEGYIKDVFPVIKKYIPMILCSDNHNINEYKLKENCWIKANPTFEGLKQVICEPNRINISEFNPNQKNNYQIIKEITLTDNEELFGSQTQTIGLSPDLNSIIGGKSSGKSLLLYHLAKAIMSHEKFEKLSSSDGFQKYDTLPTFELEAIWADGHISKLSENENKRPIIYIPQMYLNYMAEKKSRNEDFKHTIDDILKSNDGYSEYIDSKQNDILAFEQKIDSGIKDYFLQVSKLNDLKRELHQLGDKGAIEANIKAINLQLEQLKNSAGLTEQEISTYTELNKSNQEISRQIKELEFKNKFLTDLYEQTTQIKTKISTFIDNEFSDIKFKYQDEEFRTIVLTRIEQISIRFSSSISEYISENPLYLDELNKSIDFKNQEINKNNNKLEPLNKKIQNLEYLNQKQKELSNEHKKVEAINSKLTEIKNQEQKININLIIDLYQNLFNCYYEIVTKHEEYKKISESIDLLSEISFDVDDFHRDFSDYITKNRALETIFTKHGFKGNRFNFIKDEHIENIRHICKSILNNIDSPITFNQGKEKEEIITALFKNYFDISYDLMQGNDRLGHMSPGKKGIILFQLFLHMSSSKDPILIDQPEDNLDNRTVYQELNDFIKEKKLQRQIIIVSHNSNLVVSTDSENVIVAHQNSNDIQPKFEYINGALENTFTNQSETNILKKQGIREHVCEILEGGVEAFKKREKKYNI